MTAHIIGVGQTPMARSGEGPAAGELATDAIRRAADDAGIDVRSVDGIVSYVEDGSISHAQLCAWLGMRELRFSAETSFMGGGAAATLQIAAMAVESRAASTVVCYRAVSGRQFAAQMARPNLNRPFYLDAADFLRPVGWSSYLQLYALLAGEYMSRYSATRDELGAMVVSIRSHAQTNPNALRRDPLTLDEYLASPLVVDPFIEADAYVPADGACAAIVSGPQTWVSSATQRVVIANTAMSAGVEPSSWWEMYPLRPDPLASPAVAVAAQLFNNGGVRHEDVDVAELYDCASIVPALLLEDYGLVPRGEALHLAAEGHFGPGGRLPVTTHGGNLNEGYLHGFSHIIEAVRQLRGISTGQVEGAEVALVASGVPGPSSGALLVK